MVISGGIVALGLGGLAAYPATADTSLCGTTISEDLTLIEDLDCLGRDGGAAISVMGSSCQTKSVNTLGTRGRGGRCQEGSAMAQPFS